MDNSSNIENNVDTFDNDDELFQIYDSQEIQREDYNLNNSLDDEIFNQVDKPYRERFIIPVKHIIRIEENDNKDEIQQ